MIKKVLTAIISTLLFGVLMGILNYLTMPYGTYQDFWAPMFFFALYAAPVYLIGGIPFSYMIDKFLLKINFSSDIARHYTKYGLYIFIGIVVAFIYNTILAITEDGVDFSQNLFPYLIGGVIASLIYYYVSLIFDKKVSK